MRNIWFNSLHHPKILVLGLVKQFTDNFYLIWTSKYCDHLKAQNKLCDEFNSLMDRKKEVKEIYKKMENSDTTEELKCLKELYKTAKDLGIFRRVEILNEIVEEGFDAACQGRVNERMDWE